MTEDFLAFVDELPETEQELVRTVLLEFFDAARRATSFMDIVLAAGVAHERFKR